MNIRNLSIRRRTIDEEGNRDENRLSLVRADIGSHLQ